MVGLDVDPQLRALTQNLHSSKYCSGTLTFEEATAGEIRSNPHMEHVIQQAIKREFAKANVPPESVQVSLQLPADGASNTLTWKCKVGDGSKVDFAKVRGVISETVSTLSMAESLLEFGEVCTPKVRALKVKDMALVSTATDKTHHGGSATMNNINARTWKVHSRELKQIAHKTLNQMATEAMGKDAAEKFAMSHGAFPLATAVHFNKQDGGSIQVDWSYDDSIASQVPECKEALEKFVNSMQTPNGVAALSKAFKKCAAAEGVPSGHLSRSHFQAMAPTTDAKIGGDFATQMVRTTTCVSFLMLLATTAVSSNATNALLLQAGVKRKWVQSRGGFNAAALQAIPDDVMKRATQDAVAAVFWKHGMNVPRDLISVITSSEGIVQYKVRMPDNSMSEAAQRELDHYMKQDPKAFMSKLKICLASELELDADEDSKELTKMNMSRDKVKHLLAGSHDTITAVEELKKPDVVGRITLGGMRSKAVLEHMESLNSTLSELCFHHGINARFKLQIDKSAKKRRGMVKLKYEALTGDAFDGAQIQSLLESVFDSSANKKNLDGVEFIDSFKKRVERKSGTDGMLALQRMKLVKAEADTTKKLDEMEGAELSTAKPFGKVRQRKSRLEGKSSTSLVRASELVSATEVADMDEVGVTRAKRRRERKSRRERREAAAMEDGTVDKVSERRRRRGERRKRGEVNEAKEKTRLAAMKAEMAVAKAEAAKAEGAILSGIFVLSGIDHDEVTNNVKKHMVDAMLTTLVGLEATVTADNVKLKSVTSLSNGHQSISFELNIPKVAHDSPVVEQAKTRLKRGIERSSGRSFVSRVTRTLAKSGDMSLKFNADLAVESVSRIEVLGASAQIASKPRLAAIGKFRGMTTSVLATMRFKDGIDRPKDTAMKKGSVSISNLADRDFKTMRKVLKGILVDAAYDLGIQINAKQVQVEPSTKRDGSKAVFDFHVMIPQEDLAAGNVAEELENELHDLLHVEEKFVAAVTRKATELGCGPWANGPVSLRDASVDEFDVVDDKGKKHKLRRALTKARGSLAVLAAAHEKNADLFKTLKGSVKLKNTTAADFNSSVSMNKALKECVMSLLTKVGLDSQECRVKIESVEDEPEANRVKVNYGIRLKASAKAKAPNVAEVLKQTFTDRANRQVFIDGFWKKAEKMDNRMKRRASRRASRSPITRMESITAAKAAPEQGEQAVEEGERLARPSVRRSRKTRSDAEGADTETVAKAERRRERRRRKGGSEGKSDRGDRSERRSRRSRSKSKESSPRSSESKSKQRRAAKAAKAADEDFDA